MPPLHPEARAGREAWRAQAADALAQEEMIERLFNILRVFGVEAVLVKGWACARLYANAGLRPYGDVDLCVRPDHFNRSREVLGRYPVFRGIDLHSGVSDLPDRTWEGVVGRSEVVPLRSASVRLLGPEDHLRLVALHLVRHGAWRPLWLCDAAAAVEAAPPGFDWDYCLSGRRSLSRWVLDVVGLASRLLGARLEAAPPRVRNHEVPDWLARTVLWRWGKGRTRQPLGYYLARPREALEGLYFNGLNPIKATYRLGIRPRRLGPLLAVQAAAFLARGVEIPGRIYSQVARRWLTGSAGYVLHRPGTF